MVFFFCLRSLAGQALLGSPKAPQVPKRFRPYQLANSETGTSVWTAQNTTVRSSVTGKHLCGKRFRVHNAGDTASGSTVVSNIVVIVVVVWFGFSPFRVSWPPGVAAHCHGEKPSETAHGGRIIGFARYPVYNNIHMGTCVTAV